MVQSVLSSLTLGYRPLWNQARRLAGVQLYLHEEPGVQADVAHLLRILRETWGTQSPPVLLSPQSRQVLCDLLENASKEAPGSRCAATGCRTPPSMTWCARPMRAA